MGVGLKSETWAIVSDVHFPEHDEATWNAFKLWFQRVKPHGLVMLGDMLDLEQLSRFTQTGMSHPYLLPTLRRFVDEVVKLRSSCQRVVIVGGNHESRWSSIIQEAHRMALQGMVGFTLREQLESQGLPADVEWYEEEAGWSGFRIGGTEDNPRTGVTLRHGDADYKRGGPVHVAAHIVRTRYAGRSTAMGHVHRLQLYTHGDPDEKTVYGLTNPTMQKTAHWDPRAHWVRGFTILEHDPGTGYVHPYPVIIEGGRFAWAGQVYDGTQAAQSLKPRKTGTTRRKVHWHGRDWSVAELAREWGMKRETLSSRLRKGWGVREALYTPVDERMRALSALGRGDG